MQSQRYANVPTLASWVGKFALGAAAQNQSNECLCGDLGTASAFHARLDENLNQRDFPALPAFAKPDQRILVVHRV